MDPLWTCGGRFFGYRENKCLWTQDGRHVGRFENDEIYGCGGAYLGEIMDANRLITCCGKKSWKRGRFIPYARRFSIVPSADYTGFVMYWGFEDFPSPERL